MGCRLRGLIGTLQNSILGVWLALAQTGSTLTCQSDLASPHVHRMVPRFPAVAAFGVGAAASTVPAEATENQSTVDRFLW